MCIRDRSNVDGYLKDGAVSNSAAETVNYKVVAGGVNVFDPTAPVSYTHLDVYKRQASRLSECLR